MLGPVINSALPGAEVAGATSLEDVLTRTTDVAPALVLLDLDSSGYKGIRAIIEFRTRFPESRVIVASVREAPAFIHALLKAGASGYLPKSARPNVMAAALRIVVEGSIYVPPQALQMQMGASSLDRKHLVGGKVTPRQIEILRLICKGFRNVQIAKRLAITQGTVKQHVHALFIALQVALLASRVNAYAYEFFEDERGGYPLAVAGAEISGRLAVIYAAYYLQSSQGGRGLLLPHVPGAQRARILIIGYGNSGGAAARLALAMGAEVTVLGRSLAGLRKFQGTVGDAVRCAVNSPEILAHEIRTADVVIGALLVSTNETPEMIGLDLVATMRPGSILIDVTCGYGRGYLSSFDRFSTLEEPSYTKNGVLHIKIDNMSSGVPLSAVHAVNAVSIPYLLALGDVIYGASPGASMERFGQLTCDGNVISPILQELFRATA
jgi:alanine dehydrogenase